jgi:hypothetical protein
VKDAPSTFSDFLSPTSSEEGPVKTKNIPRERYKKRRIKRKKRREQRA